LRRALGIPTPPPERPFTEWVARMLFRLAIGDGGDGRRVGWTQLQPELERYEAVGGEGSWDLLRRLAAKGHELRVDVSTDVAAWMDDGMFARWVLGDQPSYEYLLEEVKRTTTPEAFTQIRRLLRKWGLRSHVRRAG